MRLALAVVRRKNNLSTQRCYQLNELGKKRLCDNFIDYPTETSANDVSMICIYYDHTIEATLLLTTQLRSDISVLIVMLLFCILEN